MSVRRNQCEKCPWKKSTNPHDIPGGYCERKHAGLASTIAEPGSVAGLGGPIQLMACHESPVGHEQPCVGWLAHQLGPGNNIQLRVIALDGRFRDLQLDGEQHERFEDTLPRKTKAR